jgi:hypothetical protein
VNDKITKTSLGKGGKGQTDWKRVDALTDEGIAQAITEDPDTFEPEPEWLQRAIILRPGQAKTRVTAEWHEVKPEPKSKLRRYLTISI